MSETTGGGTPPALEISTPAPAVAEPTPVAAPVETTPATPEPVAAPVAEPTPTTPEPVAEPALRTHDAELPSALSTEAPKPEGEPKTSDPAPAPLDPTATYEFTMPEGVTLDKARLNPYVGLLRENGITPQMGQKLLDMYVAERQQDAVNTLEQQHRAFAEYRRQSLNEVKADPELGGAGYETTRAAALRGLNLLLGDNPVHRAEYEKFLNVTGAGEQKVLFRLLVAADRKFREPAAPIQPAGPAQNAQGQGPRSGVMGLFKSKQGVR